MISRRPLQCILKMAHNSTQSYLFSVIYNAGKEAREEVEVK